MERTQIDMTPCEFKFPCKPNDTVYLVTSSGVVRLIVSQFQVVENINGDVEAAICFPNYPFITLDEANLLLFGSLDEALLVYNTYRKEGKI